MTEETKTKESDMKTINGKLVTTSRSGLYGHVMNLVDKWEQDKGNELLRESLDEQILILKNWGV